MTNDERLTSLAQDLLADGFPVGTIISQMLEFIIAGQSGMANMPKAKLAAQFAESDKQIVDGAAERGCRC